MIHPVTPTYGQDGYSSLVKLWFDIDGQRIDLCNVGADFARFTSPPVTAIRGKATLVVSIDGDAFETSVVIDDVIDEDTVAIRPDDSIPF